uniref:Reverse transcriptase domain-containing protein n=1 Tax=Brassica oleracea TaxID=3712 RepID=A0A3P6FQK3_BRAOL|nr:unnamed protein product [Brassica oleracea]
MKHIIALKKKNDPGKFAMPCLVKGIEFPCARCVTGSSVNILPKVMADHLGLKIEPSQNSFTFVDHSTRNSGDIIRDLEVQIGNALVSVDFHVLENKQNKNHSLLLGRAFMATVRAVCNMQTNQLSFTLIYLDVYYDPVRVVSPQTSNTGDEYKTEYSGSIDSETPPLIIIAFHPPIEENLQLLPHCYPRFDVATQPQTAIDYHYGDTISRPGDYSIGSWADDSLHESFAVDTELPKTRADEYERTTTERRTLSTMVLPWMIEDFSKHGLQM